MARSYKDTEEIIMSVAEPVEEVQFTIDQHGRITAVVVSPELWQRIIDALEASEDRALVQTLRSRLAQGPVASGALSWQDVSDQWQ